MVDEEILQMKSRELKRLQVLGEAASGKLTQGEAGAILGLSGRQIRRLSKRLRAEGEKGVIHRGRGRPSNRRFPFRLRRRALGLYRRKYEGFGPTLASEKLGELDGIVLSAETLRQWLRQEGMEYQRRRVLGHRRWRERRACFGAMVQMDGSHHDWLEGRGPELVLMGYIDDATNTVHGRFYDYEGTLPAFDSFQRYARRYGIPASVYLDRHSTYKAFRELTAPEQLQGLRKPESQFERAMRELGVEVIHAHSPQAKGRVERLFGTLQDRLVKEMRLQGIKSAEAANAFLEKYLVTHNQRFGVEASSPANAHRQVTGDLNAVLCIKTERRLSNDATVAHGGKCYQIESRVRARTVMVEERVEGSLRISHRGVALTYRELPARPRRRLVAAIKPRRRQIKPPANHPWRKWRGGNTRRRGNTGHELTP